MTRCAEALEDVPMNKQTSDASAQETITLPSGVIAPSWELVRPLTVTIGADEDGWNVLSDEVFQVYGDGDTLEDARRDYIASLIEYYRMVERDSDNGDESARRELDRVQAYVRHRM
jgi:hypothetical protein